MHTKAIESNPGEACPVCSEKRFVLVNLGSGNSCLVRCLGCGLAYRNPSISQDELSRRFHEVYYNPDGEMEYLKNMEEWFFLESGQYQYALNFIKEEGGLNGKSVLEVGCGYGRFLSECRKCGALITGVDPHPRAVASAKRYYDIDIIGKEIEEAARENLVPAGSFDFIFTFEVLEHIKNPGAFLSVLRGLLKPGGLLFISTPNLSFYFLVKNTGWFIESYPEHLTFFEISTLRDTLGRYGFKVRDISTASRYTYGFRQKQILSHKPIIRFIWQRMRNNSYLYKIKDLFFRILDKHQQPVDRQKLNGSELICIAERQ